MRIIVDHVVESGHFVSRSVRRRLQFCDVISMPPSKVCPQCEAYRAFAAFAVFHILSVLRVH